VLAFARELLAIVPTLSLRTSSAVRDEVLKPLRARIAVLDVVANGDEGRHSRDRIGRDAVAVARARRPTLRSACAHVGRARGVSPSMGLAIHGARHRRLGSHALTLGRQVAYSRAPSDCVRDGLPRLCALVPPPRSPMRCYRGVLAAHAAARPSRLLTSEAPLRARDPPRHRAPAPRPGPLRLAFGSAISAAPHRSVFFDLLPSQWRALGGPREEFHGSGSLRPTLAVVLSRPHGSSRAACRAEHRCFRQFGRPRLSAHAAYRRADVARDRAGLGASCGRPESLAGAASAGRDADRRAGVTRAGRCLQRRHRRRSHRLRISFADASEVGCDRSQRLAARARVIPFEVAGPRLAKAIETEGIDVTESHVSE
jgi:hypothetical protein